MYCVGFVSLGFVCVLFEMSTLTLFLCRMNDQRIRRRRKRRLVLVLLVLLLLLLLIIIIILMGAKKSASKDRGYVTASEWQRDGGGKTLTNTTLISERRSMMSIQKKKLPFHCCALSFLPFGDHPVVSLKSGAMYDLDAVLPYVMKHKKDPVTGETMKTSDLKPLKLKKCLSTNTNGRDDSSAHNNKYECPILGSEFTNATKICVVKKTGMYFEF